MKLRSFLNAVVAILLVCAILIPPQASAVTLDRNRIMDDSIFNNFNSMSAGQIDTFLNGFPYSCISPNSGFRAIDPTGYNPSTGFQYGGYVTAGQVIYDAGQAYGLNPQVLLTTLQKEQSLVAGGAGYCNNGDEHKYAAAVGYGCPDGGTRYSYTGLSLYQRNGVVVSNTGTTCVNSASKAGFSQQVIRAAWLLKFGQQRARGNINWAVIKGNWNNSDDPQSCYGGPTMEGTFAVCPSSPATYHDGYYTIDGATVHIDSGATAALYWYTPHFSGNQNFVNIFSQWFGSTRAVSMPGCAEATNTTIACVWFMLGPQGQPYYTSSISDRQWLADHDGYDYCCKAFFGNVTPLTGNVPVYRLVKPDNSSFLTASRAEYDALVAGGWLGLGVDFYANPGNSNAGYPIFRLYRGSTQTHQWAISLSDRDALISQGYSYEGVAFTSISTVRQEVAPPAGQDLVYRFGNMPGNIHFWTRDTYERDQMINAGYRYEGTAWRASQTATSVPVYRVYSPTSKEHLFTADEWEGRVLTSQGWISEGVAWYATASGAPVYRLYSPTSHEHFFTTDAWERGVLIRNGTFRDEGIAWYQP